MAAAVSAACMLCYASYGYCELLRAKLMIFCRVEKLQKKSFLHLLIFWHKNVEIKIVENTFFLELFVGEEKMYISLALFFA